MHSWSAKDMDLLRSMWAEGNSMGLIAARLGVSRSAIAGKISAMKLPKKGKPTGNPDAARERKRAADRIYQKRKAAEARARKASGLEAAPVAKKPPRAVVPKKPKAKRPKVETAVSAFPRPSVEPRIPMPTEADLQIEPLMLYEQAKKHTSCQFIIGADYLGNIRRGEPMFCGRPVSNSSVYCSTHHRLCYRAPGDKGDGSAFKRHASAKQWDWNR